MPDITLIESVRYMIRTYPRNEMGARLAEYIYRSDDLKARKNKDSDSLGRIIAEIEQHFGKIPSNAKWIITTGMHSPEQYKGRVFIYDSFAQARRDNDVLVGKLTMAEYVGDGELDG